MMKVVHETSEGETWCKVTGLFFKSSADDCGAVVRKFVNNRRECVLCPSPSKLAKKKGSTMVQESILRVILTRCDVGRECSFNLKQSGGSQVEKENLVFPTTATKVESEFSSAKVVESDSTVTRSVNTNDRRGNTPICLNLQADLEQTDCSQSNFCVTTEKDEEEEGLLVNDRREYVLCPSPPKLAKKKNSTRVQESILRVILTRCDVGRECSFNQKQSGGSQVEKENLVFPTTATKVESEFSSTQVVESEEEELTISDSQTNSCIQTEKGDEEEGLTTSDLQAKLCIQTEKDEEEKGPTTVDSQTNMWIKTEKVDEEEELIISDSQTDSCIQTEKDEEKEGPTAIDSQIDVRIKTEKVDEEEEPITIDSQTDWCIQTEKDEKEEGLIISDTQTDLFIKTEKVEKEEGLVTNELVGCLVSSDSLKTEADHHEGTMTEIVDLRGNIPASSNEPTDFLPFSFPQTNKYIKTGGGEKRKAPVTIKLVDYKIADDMFVTAVDSREETVVETASDLQAEVSCPLNKVTKLEQFDVSQTNELIQAEGKEEEKVPITSESTDHAIADGFFETTIDNREETAGENALQIGITCSLKKSAEETNSQTERFSKTRKGNEKECQVTSVLVSYLPASLKDGEVVSKPPLKFVNCERSEVTADNDPQASSDPPAIVCNSKRPKESTSQKSVEVEEEHSVLSQIGSESNGCEKLYVCSICPYKSKREVCLRIHRRIHSGSKPYKCTYCAASFTHKESLTDHLKVHSSRESFVQKLCSTNVTHKQSQ